MPYSLKDNQKYMTHPEDQTEEEKKEIEERLGRKVFDDTDPED